MTTKKKNNKSVDNKKIQKSCKDIAENISEFVIGEICKRGQDNFNIPDYLIELAESEFAKFFPIKLSVFMGMFSMIRSKIKNLDTGGEYGLEILLTGGRGSAALPPELFNKVKDLVKLLIGNDKDAAKLEAFVNNAATTISTIIMTKIEDSPEARYVQDKGIDLALRSAMATSWYLHVMGMSPDGVFVVASGGEESEEETDDYKSNGSKIIVIPPRYNN